MTVNWEWFEVYGGVVATALGTALAFSGPLGLGIDGWLLAPWVAAALIAGGMVATGGAGIRAARAGRLKPASALAALALGIVTVVLWLGPVFNGVAAGLCTSDYFAACHALQRRGAAGPLARKALKNRDWVAYQCVEHWEPRACRQAVKRRILEPAAACAHVAPAERSLMKPYCARAYQRPRFIW